MGRLEGKVAIVTGGASGMGKATALRFAEEGASVLVTDLNASNGEALLREAAQCGHGEMIAFVPGDVANEEDVSNAVTSAVSRFGRLDIVFNNAGVGGAFGPITDIDGDAWDYTFAVNCRGVFFGIKHAARVMIAQGYGGSIINTASLAGLTGDSGGQAYSSAKAGVINLTKTAAVELAEYKIRVNAICPGAILTPLLHRGKKEAAAQAMADLQPWPQHGDPDDIAGVALFFASDDSLFVTGEELLVDGGLLAAGPRVNARLARFMKSPAHTAGINRGTTGQIPTVTSVPARDRSR